MNKQPFRLALDVLSDGALAPVDNQRRSEAAHFCERAKHWWKQPGVCGLGIGRRTVEGEELAELALKVYVERKLPHVKLMNPAPEYIEVPGVCFPLPVDVVEAGVMQLQAARERPALGGSEISHFLGTPGSIGCLVRRRNDPAATYILSNAHVLAPPGESTIGDPIVQPSVETDRDIKNNIVATLADWIRFKTSSNEEFPNEADAAIARVKPGLVDSLIKEMGRPTGVGYFVAEGMGVRLFGSDIDTRTRTVQHGIIIDTDHRLVVNQGSQRIGFRNQVVCVAASDPTRAITRPGDSGTAVLNSRGRVVGLHFYGSPKMSVFNRIKPILDTFQVDVVTGPLPLGNRPRTGSRPATVVPPDVLDRDDAIDVMARTLWGEAMDQGEAGIRAVAEVIANRCNRLPRHWWGSQVETVCRKPFQFSCWNEDDPNRGKLLNVKPSDTQFSRCLDVAEDAINGRVTEQTGGATHYLTKERRAQGWPDTWGDPQAPCAEVKDHLFYKGIE